MFVLPDSASLHHRWGQGPPLPLSPLSPLHLPAAAAAAAAAANPPTTTTPLPPSPRPRSFWYYTLGYTSGGEGFASADDFQKALWWYNGAMDASFQAFPPTMSATELTKNGQVMMASLRLLFGGEPDDGQPAQNPIGQVSTPSLYVCGTADTAILCSKPYAQKTKDYIAPDVAYTYLEVDCGHDLLTSCGYFKSDQIQKTMDAIQAHLDAN